MGFIFDFRPEKTMGPIGRATGQGRRTVAGRDCNAAVTHGPATQITGILGLKRLSSVTSHPPLLCTQPSTLGSTDSELVQAPRT